MSIEDLNITWVWDRGCAWQCAWGLDKQTARGYFACETLHYTHKVKNQTGASKPAADGLSAHIVGIITGAVVFVVIGMCFMCRMLQD
jgi:hypothetical protein